MNKETEVKIKINDKELQRIEVFLGLDDKIWNFERTYGFFTPDGESIKKGIFPRIKTNSNGNYGKLCIKVKERKDVDYFERKEYEFASTKVEDYMSLMMLFGYTDIRIFDKLRKEKNFERTMVSLDKLPFGIYIEIEGDKKPIENVIKILGLENNERIVGAYLKLADDLGLRNAVFGGEIVEQGKSNDILPLVS